MLGSKLKEARLSLGYTQEQVALQIGVKKSTYTGYEIGNSEPDIDKLTKIMAVLGVDANYLIQDEMLAAGVKVHVYNLAERKLIDNYRALDESAQSFMDTAMDFARSKTGTEQTNGQGTTIAKMRNSPRKVVIVRGHRQAK